MHSMAQLYLIWCLQEHWMDSIILLMYNFNLCLQKKNSERIQFIHDILFPSIRQHCAGTITKRNKYWIFKSNIVKALEPGSIVMARISGKRPKLRLPFISPYRVVWRTLGGIYLIVDANGTILPREFQISKLKPILAQTLTTEFFAKAILNDKQESDGSKTYKVR